MLDLLDCNGKKDIKSMTLEEVTAEMAALGEKSFRAKQLYDWMHVQGIARLAQFIDMRLSFEGKFIENENV